MKIPKDTNYWLDRVKKERTLSSDSAVAELLGATRQAVSQQRAGKNQMSIKSAIQTGWILGIDPLEVIGAVMFHTEKNNKNGDPEFWRALWVRKCGERLDASKKARPSEIKASAEPLRAAGSQ
ncbi:hypothetical protein D3C80_1780080 [compost metagenome]